jgi:hypothetical protein
MFASTMLLRRHIHEVGFREVLHDPVHRLTRHTMPPCELAGVKHLGDRELLENMELGRREVDRAQRLVESGRHAPVRPSKRRDDPVRGRRVLAVHEDLISGQTDTEVSGS